MYYYSMILYYTMTVPDEYNRYYITYVNNRNRILSSFQSNIKILKRDVDIKIKIIQDKQILDQALLDKRYLSRLITKDEYITREEIISDTLINQSNLVYQEFRGIANELSD